MALNKQYIKRGLMTIHRTAPMRPLLKMSFFLPSSRKFFAPPIILNTKWGVGLVDVSIKC